MTPWLSVVMPVHNGERFLAATLESAAREQPGGVEFIILDSSSDLAASRGIADAFRERLDIRWTAAADDPSWTAKTNRGVMAARARHVCMLHQDDLWLPGHLAALRAARDAAPDAALSIGPSLFIDARGQPAGHWRLPFEPGSVNPEDFLATLIVQNTIAIPSPVIDRSRWLDCGGLDEELWYTADWDLYLKLGRYAPVHVRSAETTAFRIHGGSLTMTGARDAASFRRQLESVLDRHLPLIPPSHRGVAGQRARVSVEINCLLATAAQGGRADIGRLAGELLKLGPLGLAGYLRQSRLIDRLWPRLRLGLRGSMS